MFGSIALKGARLDDVALKNYRETTDPNSPNIVLLSPSGRAGRLFRRHQLCRAARRVPRFAQSDDAVEGRRREADRKHAGHPVLRQWPGPGVPSQDFASTNLTCSRSPTRSMNKGTEPVTLFPMRSSTRHGMPKTSGYAVLHEGLIGVIGAEARSTDSPMPPSPRSPAKPSLAGRSLRHRRLARLYRQILGHGDHPRPERALQGLVPRLPRHRAAIIRPISSPRPRPSRPAPARRDHPRLRRRERNGTARALPERSRHPEIRHADRLGLVLLHHQADVLAARRASTSSSAISASPS